MSAKMIQASEQALTLAEASATYEVSSSHLLRMLKCGSLWGYKVRGPRVMEWRISVSAIEDAGFERRAEVIDLTDESSSLRRQVQQLARNLTVQRRRNEELDGRLGYALLTVGRLRGALRAAGLNPDELFGADLTTDTGTSASQRSSDSRRTAKDGLSRSSRRQ